MRRLVAFLLPLFLLVSTCFSQEADLKKFIKAWSVSDTNQTQSAEKTYFILKQQYNAKKFEKFEQQLSQYIADHPEKRLWARLKMFQVLGKREFSIPLLKQDTLKIVEAIKIARNLKDDQLLAEIYALAADIDFEGGYLLYNLKAIELQRKIGFKYFSFVQNRFFGSSLALYQVHNFTESIAYGKKCLQFKDVKVQAWDPMVYIFQLDVIGASYLALRDYDKAIGYYQQIVDTVATNTYSTGTGELWTAIANGNIGRCLFYKGEIKRAWELVNKHLAIALKYKQWNNVALAENARGEFFIRQQQYSAALAAFKHALSAAVSCDKLEDKLKATDGLWTCYVNLGKADSALFYKNEYVGYLKQHTQILSRSRLSAMDAKMRFDTSQRNLEDANISISRLKQTRNIVIIAIVLMVFIGWLIYNRQTLKNKLEKQKIIFENAQAKAAVDKAKNSLLLFKKQMVDKDKLIENLSQSLRRNAIDHTDGDLFLEKKLMSYVLVTDEEWMNFRKDFEKVYPVFYSRLHVALSGPSPAEERLACLIALQMTTREMAAMLGISPDSVNRSKRRLKKRLALTAEQELDRYIFSFVN